MTTESRKWREGLAERLRALVGRNEADFARQIAVQPATFNTYMTGRTVPPLDVIWRAAGGYDDTGWYGVGPTMHKNGAAL